MTTGLRTSLVVLHEAIQRLVFSLPRFRMFNYLKAVFLRASGAKIGKRVVFYPGLWIAPGRGLNIGDDVDLALDVVITTAGGVKIGDRTLVGYRAQIISANHSIPPGRGHIFGAGHDFAAVTIGDDVWIGANAIVLPGVDVGEGAVIGAGSVVTKSIPPFAVAAGVPAEVIRRREQKENSLSVR